MRYDGRGVLPAGVLRHLAPLGLGVLLLAVATLGAAHPGPVSPRDGCHECRKNCERYGIPQGRHCHPERLDAARAAAPAPSERDNRSSSVAKTGSEEALEGRQAYVDKVIDGDTLEVRVDGGRRVRVRVLGIDCPESHANEKCARDGRQGRMGCDAQVPLGLKASRRAAELLKHRAVTLEGPIKSDLYGRTLAYIRMDDGRDFGAVMIREGLCEDFGWKYPHPRTPQYRQ